MGNIKIREAIEADLPSIIDFQIKMAWETEDFKLDKDTVTLGVNALFNDKQKGKYWVAEVEEEIVASLMTLYEWSDWRNGNVVWIHSVFVSSTMRKQGIFKQMYQHLQKIVLEGETLKGLRLYVDKTNLNAQKVYESLGMTKEHYELYEWLK